MQHAVNIIENRNLVGSTVGGMLGFVLYGFADFRVHIDAAGLVERVGIGVEVEGVEAINFFDAQGVVCNRCVEC